jgi:hypothetical protein
VLQKGTMDCRWLELSLLDSLLCDEIGNEAHLPDHSRDLGMVSVDDVVTNSSEATRSDMKNREIGWGWEGLREQRGIRVRRLSSRQIYRSWWGPGRCSHAGNGHVLAAVWRRSLGVNLIAPLPVGAERIGYDVETSCHRGSRKAAVQDVAVLPACWRPCAEGGRRRWSSLPLRINEAVCYAGLQMAS